MFSVTGDYQTSWRLDSSKVGLLVVDAQEKLMPVMHESAALEKKLTQLLRGASLLGMPVHFSEQYPQGLGTTLPSLRSIVPDAPVYSKTRFSAGDFLADSKIRHWLVAGIEAHICIRQTVYDLRLHEKIPYLVVDAVGSRDPVNKQVALSEMQSDRVFVTTVESVLFELMADSTHPQFKAVSSLIR